MRIIVDIAEVKIREVSKNPPDGDPQDITGKFVIPVPEGVALRVTPQSIVLPSGDPNSVISQSYAGLLARFPQFSNILYNPLLEAADMADLDPSGFLNEGEPIVASYPARFQMGRGVGPLPLGGSLGSVAMLESNESLGPGLERPGVIVTDTIDIGPYTSNQGSDEFMVYWYLYDISVSVDVSTDFGYYAGSNEPSLRSVLEVDQEPVDFQAFISINNGVNYFPVNRMIPVAFCEPGKQIKLAFKNTATAAKKYLAAYALLF